MYYKLQRIISSHVDFSKILGKKTVKELNLSSKVEDLKLAKLKCFRVPVLMIAS